MGSGGGGGGDGGAGVSGVGDRALSAPANVYSYIAIQLYNYTAICLYSYVAIYLVETHLDIYPPSIHPRYRSDIQGESAQLSACTIWLWPLS